MITVPCFGHLSWRNTKRLMGWIFFNASWHHLPIVTPRACARGKAIGLSVVCRSHHKNRQIWRYRHLSDSVVSTTNPSKSAKNWLQYASNPLARSTSVANSAFMLATPIDHTYCWPCAFCSCAQLAKCKQVKVINNTCSD